MNEQFQKELKLLADKYDIMMTAGCVDNCVVFVETGNIWDELITDANDEKQPDHKS